MRKQITTTVKNETLESLRDLAYTERRNMNEIIDDSIAAYIKNKGSENEGSENENLQSMSDRKHSLRLLRFVNALSAGQRREG